MKNIIIILLSFLLTGELCGQYDDYLGAGHNVGIQVRSSNNDEGTRAEHTISGNGLDAKRMEISRFLSQTTFGETLEEIDRVAELGMEAWIDEQTFMPENYLTPMFWDIWEEIDGRYQDAFDVYLARYILELCEAAEEDPSIETELTEEQVEELREFYEGDLFGPSALQFNYAWSHNCLTGKDQLRQRVAYALSQILVVSSRSDLGDHGESLTSYYDILLHHSFGNFKDMLMEITLSPAMGVYLSHFNNPRAIPENNIHPDENYAREILQLFTIGLYELNLDGTRKQDANGNDIPTYDNDDIKELAKVFTGLGSGTTDPRMDHINWSAYFGMDFYSANKTDPMVMYEEWHEPGEKTILKDLIIPAGQSGMQDIEMAVDYIFNHPNVGPFISRQLIQRLIKSNPTAGYIRRVATVFNDNGQGVRGDMTAVIKAILLDDEARSCENLLNEENGKLKEPVLRYSQFLRIMPKYGERYDIDVTIDDYNCGGVSFTIDTIVFDNNLRLWNNGYNYFDGIRQYPLMSPSVFNFYLPDHQPVGEITERGLVAPEFKIHDTGTAINYINMVHMYTAPYYDLAWYNWIINLGFEDIKFNYDLYTDMYNDDPEELIHNLDIMLTHGQMSEDLKQTLRQFLEDNPGWIDNNGYEKISVKTLFYLILWSPDYTIDK